MLWEVQRAEWAAITAGARDIADSAARLLAARAITQAHHDMLVRACG
jgi:hypothetical protein